MTKNEITNANFKAINTMIRTLDISKLSDEEFFDLCAILREDNRKNVQSLERYLVKNKEAFTSEVKRVKALYEFDRALAKGNIVAGVDEVGRGPLAGPIVAAAVILDNSSVEDIILYINDSKAIAERKREELAEEIKKRAISYSIASCSNNEIDEKGIGYCNNKIFLDAVHGLSMKPHLVLSDGYKIKDYPGDNIAIIKGDAKSASIACASIIAKVYRDKLMKEYHETYPDYDFFHNVGYGSTKHLNALKELGPTKLHRMSFLKKIPE